MSNWVKRKLDWLEAVAEDPRTRGLPGAIAVKLATRYLNSRSEEAWPGIERLAEELRANPRNIRRAINVLVASGWLGRERGGGRGKSNHYRIKEGVHARVSAVVKGGAQDRKGGRTGPQRGAHAPPEHRNRTRDEHRYRHGGAQTDHSGGRAGPSRSSTTRARRSGVALFPSKWGFGAAEIATAQRHQVWGPDEARREFAKFRQWHTDRVTRSADWSVSWDNWCVKGSEIAARKSSQAVARPDKVADSIAGLRQWGEKQNAAALYVSSRGPSPEGEQNDRPENRTRLQRPR